MQWLLLLALLLAPEQPEHASAAALEALPAAASIETTSTVPSPHDELIPFVTEGESMSPAIHSGDRLSVDSEYYGSHALQRGDIIIFHAPDERNFVKRVVGLPGETIAIEKSKLEVNGKANSELSLAGNESVVEGLKLAKDQLYVLGDNYKISYDSRYIGPIRTGSIIGKVVGIEHASASASAPSPASAAAVP